MSNRKERYTATQHVIHSMIKGFAKLNLQSEYIADKVCMLQQRIMTPV